MRISRALRAASSSMAFVGLTAGCNQLLDNQSAAGILLDGGPSGDGGKADGALNTPLDGGCPTGATSCAGSGGANVCVDLSQDPAHCGACDHVCESCQAGKCQPVRVGSTLDSPVALGIDPGNVFLLTNALGASAGTLVRASLAPGATAAPALTALDRPSAMGVDSTTASRVFLAVAAGAGQSKVLSFSGTGAPTELTAISGLQVGALDVSSSKLWGTDLKGGRVWQAGLDGADFTADNAQVTGLALSGIDTGAGLLVVGLRSTPCVQMGEVMRWNPGTKPAAIGDPIACPQAVAMGGATSTWRTIRPRPRARS